MGCRIHKAILSLPNGISPQPARGGQEGLTWGLKPVGYCGSAAITSAGNGPEPPRETIRSRQEYRNPVHPANPFQIIPWLFCGNGVVLFQQGDCFFEGRREAAAQLQRGLLRS